VPAHFFSALHWLSPINANPYSLEQPGAAKLVQSKMMKWLSPSTNRYNSYHPLQQSSTFNVHPEPKDAEPETDFSEEYKTRLKHLGLYVEASTADAYHLFLKKLPNTTAFIIIPNPMLIFIV
jgi:hypothetical protein